MSGVVRWGIVAAGRISQDFVTAMELLSSKQHQVIAVAARDKVRAQQFAAKFHIPKAYGTYEELTTDTDIDIVYVGNIHLCHAEVTKLMLNGGKHVLVEKPLCINWREATQLVELAQQRKLFLMEGYWTMFFPAFVKLRETLASGLIGEALVVRVSMGFNTEAVRTHDPTLAGGALLDYGCYAVMVAYTVLGYPESIHAVCTKRPKGNDETTVITLHYSGNRVAIITCSTSCELDNRAFIHGTAGSIELFEFWCPTRMLINGKEVSFSLPERTRPIHCVKTEGFVYEIQHVRERLIKGDIESTVVSHQMSRDIYRIMDEARRQMGVVYPNDS